MAKSKSGDGFNVDFTDMFEPEVTKPVKIKTEPVEQKSSIKEKTVEPVNEFKSKTKDISTAYSIYLLDENDRMFLQFRAQSKKMSMSDFLWELIQKDAASIKDISIDVNDENHAMFRKVSLASTTTIKATKRQRDSLVDPATKHRLKITRYVAYVVHEAMIKDKTWN